MAGRLRSGFSRSRNDVLQVQQGSLYPALQRLEQQGWIRSKWAETETGRQARFYSLTAAGGAVGEGTRDVEPAFGGDRSGGRELA